MKVSAYCRVSTEKNDQQNSLENQVSFFENFIKCNREWTLHKIYCDQGISGTQVKKRTQFQQMIEDAKKGEFELILTKEISRFGRNTIDVLHYTRLLKSYGIFVFFVNDGINTAQNDGELRLAIMASIAQEESRKISDRVKFGQTQSMKNGKVFGNGNIKGFELLKGELLPKTSEIGEIRNIFCMYTIEHKSVTAIAKILRNDEKKYSEQTISNILKNEKYVGDLLQKKSVTTDYLTHARKRNLESKIYIKNHHRAIISRKLWNLTQIEREKRKKSGKFSQKHYLSGKIYCDKCGKLFTLKNVRKNDQTIYTYWVHKDCEKVSNLSNNVLNMAINTAILLQKINFSECLEQSKKLVKKLGIEKQVKVIKYIENMDISLFEILKSEIIFKITVDEKFIYIHFKDDFGVQKIEI